MMAGASSTKQLTMFVWTPSASTSVGVDAGQAAGQPARQIVVAPVAARRDPARRRSPGGDQAGLAHPAAQHLGGAAGPLHEIAVARQDRADRSAQALAEREPDRIGMPAQRGDRHAEIGRGIEQPGAVEMDRDAGAAARRRRIAAMVSSGVTVPPAALWVFSRQISRVGASASSAVPLRAASTACGERMPRSPLSGRAMAPATADRPPPSEL